MKHSDTESVPVNTTKIQKHAGGRPTKYTPDMVQSANEYIESCGRQQQELPTIEGLALKLGVDDTTVLKWGSDNPEFLATIKNLKYLQKTQLMNDGMYGGKEVNAGMAIFLLKANHGLIETNRTEFTGKGGEPITVQFLLGNEYIPTIRAIDGTPEGSVSTSALQDGSTVQDASVA
jgi:hypothetical protein